MQTTRILGLLLALFAAAGCSGAQRTSDGGATATASAIAVASPVAAAATESPQASAATVSPPASGPGQTSAAPSESSTPVSVPSGSAPAALSSVSAPAVLPSVSAPAVIPSGSAPGILASGSAPGILASGSAPGILASGSASPIATENPNLLTLARGAFVRRWTIGAATIGFGSFAAGQPSGIKPAFAGSPEFVYELPAIAQIDRFAVEVSGSSDPAARVRFAISTADPNTFSDAGAIALAGTDDTKIGTLAGPFRARFVRVSLDRKTGSSMYVNSVSAFGTVDVPARSLAGHWALADSPTGTDDRVFDGTQGSVSPSSRVIANEVEAETVEDRGGLLGGLCNRDRAAWRGPIVAGRAHLGGGDVLAVVANGSLLVGSANGGEPILARRIPSAPACDLPHQGSGPELVVLKQAPLTNGQESDPKFLPGFRYAPVFLPIFRASDLARAHGAILAYDCDADNDVSPEQQKALLDFVAGGGSLIIRDADFCSKSDYRFVPYPFSTMATGASGARGSTLKFAESSALGSLDARDKARYIDTAAYLANEVQQIGDSDIMQTSDVHWCGLLYAKNRKGASGWVHAYARYGRGVFIFSGFDVDDIRNRIPQALTIARLDYGYSPRTPLPCSAKVALDPAGPPKAARSIPAPKRSIATQLEHGGRARIYGIHFDVASARIQPQSEATIGEIAAVLKSHPAWRMRVEGHTDSDGDAAYNRALSNDRARSVVSDLAHRFGIAAGRLVAAGFGSSRPVASNATAAGKALNRRVELVRL